MTMVKNMFAKAKAFVMAHKVAVSVGVAVLVVLMVLHGKPF